MFRGHTQEGSEPSRSNPVLCCFQTRFLNPMTKWGGRAAFGPRSRVSRAPSPLSPQKVPDPGVNHAFLQLDGGLSLSLLKTSHETQVSKEVH